MIIKNILYNLPEIETNRLMLRKLSEDDVEDVFEYTSDPLVSQYAQWSNHVNINEAVNLVNERCKSYSNHTGSIWGVYHKADSKIIGSAGFVKIDEFFSKGEIGYTLSRKYWGNGYATEIVKALIKFGFINMQLHRIEGYCNTNNIASLKVLEKANMQREGLLRDYYKKDDFYFDVYIYSILKL